MITILTINRKEKLNNIFYFTNIVLVISGVSCFLFYFPNLVFCQIIQQQDNITFPFLQKYQNREIGITLSVPLDWALYEYGSVVTFYPDDNYNSSNLDIRVKSLNNQSFPEFIKNDIRRTITGSTFHISESIYATENQTYHIESTIDDRKLLSKYFYTYPNVYIINFYAEQDKYDKYLPVIKEIIKTFEIYMNHQKPLTGFTVGMGPAGIDINTKTNKLYIANSLSNTVSVVNSANNELIDEIGVGRNPTGLAVNPSTNTIYVANTESGSVSVIDGFNNTKRNDILVGSAPFWIAVNSITNMVYVGDISSYDIYVIDGSKNEVITNISTGSGPRNMGIGIGIAVNDLTNRIYVASPVMYNIAVIDGQTNRIVGNISSSFKFSQPTDIAINPFTNIAYIVDSGYNSITAIDLSQNVTLDELEIYNGTLNTLSINPYTNKLYVTNPYIDSIHVIEQPSILRSEELLLGKTVKVDSSPLGIVVNPATKIVYVTNTDSNSVTTINGTANEKMFGVKFHFLSSSDSRDVVCNDRLVHNNDQIYYNEGTSVVCTTLQKSILNPVVATSWSNSGAPLTSESNTIKFNVTKHQTLEGMFIDLSSAMEYTGQAIAEIQKTGFYLSVIILISVIGIASAPSILIKSRTDKGWLLMDKRESQLLSKTEILGINTSLIVGVLIFLSLSDGFEEDEQLQISIITANIVFPFAISAIVAINNRERLATRLTVAGFINLIISVILIAIMTMSTGF